MADELKHAMLVGRLVASKSNKGDGHWLKLEIPKALMHGLYATLQEPGISMPDGDAHITVMKSDEVSKIGVNKISETGKYFPFRLESVKHVRPSGWSGVSRVWFVVVKSPELKKLRTSYGLTPLVNGDHEFHITIAIRKTGVLAPNSSITKHAFVGRDLLIPAAGGLAGAVLGSAVNKRKGNWLQRHIGTLLGGIGGLGAGYGISNWQGSKPAATARTDSQVPATTIPQINQSSTQPMSGAEARLMSRIPNVDWNSLDTLRRSAADPAVQQQLTADSAKKDLISGKAENELANAFMDPKFLTKNMPVSAAISAAMNAAKSPAGLRAISALRGAGTGAAFDVGAIGAGAGMMGADKLQDLVGAGTEDWTRLGTNVGTGNVTGTAVNSAVKNIVSQAAPVAEQYFPRLSRLMAKLPQVSNVASKVAPYMDAVYPATVAYDTTKSIANAANDGGQAIANKYFADKANDLAKYGPIKGSLRTIGRGVLTPGNTATTIGNELANAGGADALVRLGGATSRRMETAPRERAM